MQIQNAVKIVNSIPDSWVRVEHVRRISGGLEVCFTIHEGQRGKRTGGWKVTCRGVREAKITDIDGGGLRVYSATHPVARQYVARRAELRWPRTGDEAKVLLALYRAHTKASDDWIEFDRYLQIETPWTGTSFQPHFAPVSGSNFVCRGPDFLIHGYAKALEAIGERVQLTLRRGPKLKQKQPKVLHFGQSYVVADVFTAEREAVGGGRPPLYRKLLNAG
jgi:hypothetical protein